MDSALSDDALVHRLVSADEEQGAAVDERARKMRRLKLFGYLMLVACIFAVLIAAAVIANKPDSDDTVDDRLPTSFQVLQLTDFHYDSDNRTCQCGSGSSYCCSHVCAVSAWGKYGAMGCDSPKALVDSAIDFGNSIGSPKFVLYTGDMAGHHSPSMQITLSEVNYVYNRLRTTFSGLPLITVIGNDDIQPDYCVNAAWQGILADTWAPTLNGENAFKADSNNTNTFKSGGYYSVHPIRGLRVIAMNTVYYSPSYAKCMTRYNVTDPGRDAQMSWLQAQLQATRDANEQAWIVGHVPFGTNFVDDPQELELQPIADASWTQQFNTIVNDYRDIIQITTFGHTHRDELHIAGDRSNDVGMLIAPAVSPIFVNNPAVRMYTVAAEGMAPLDYTSYYGDLMAANVNGNMRWSRAYSFMQQYGTYGTINKFLPFRPLFPVISYIFESLPAFSDYKRFRNVMADSLKGYYQCSMYWQNITAAQLCAAGIGMDPVTWSGWNVGGRESG